MAGFHVGVRGKAAGRVVRCSAKKGSCRLVGADGEPAPHFASVAEGEAFLAERDAASRGGFTGSLLLMLFPLRLVMGAVLRGMMPARVWGR